MFQDVDTDASTVVNIHMINSDECIYEMSGLKKGISDVPRAECHVWRREPDFQVSIRH